MITTLPRSATYIQHRLNTPCSRRGCTWPGRFGTSSGSSWCIIHYGRYQLIGLAQQYYLHDAWWLKGEEYKKSDMAQAIKWISESSDEEIELTCNFFRLDV